MVTQQSENQKLMKLRGDRQGEHGGSSGDEEGGAMQQYQGGQNDHADSDSDTETTPDTEEKSAEEFREQCDDLVERMKKPGVHDWSASTEVDSDPLDDMLTLGKGPPPPEYDDSSGACHGVDVEDDDED
jgi:hypothetical protein